MQIGKSKFLITGVCAVALFGFLAVFSIDSQNQTLSFNKILNFVEASEHPIHTIDMSAESLGNGQYAYRMISHVLTPPVGSPVDLTGNYDSNASIPGPIIVINEGDKVNISLTNNIPENESLASNLVSLHVHGVHYDVNSDGTLESVNGVADQGAGPFETQEFTWMAGPGTAGSWPYHDHTYLDTNGAEHKGLFGMLIVNPASETVQAVKGNNPETVNIADIKKEFVLYLGDDAFWGMEIDNDNDGAQTPLWVNPTLKAKNNDYVRFHLVALGTDIHEFQMSHYKWLYPGTTEKINRVDIGPLENHQFTVKTKNGNAEYMDKNESNKLMGMKGTFVGSPSGGTSEGLNPLE
jgi:FtsP/CotA-like multicopper oxidase with cupredoxin domain